MAFAFTNACVSSDYFGAAGAGISALLVRRPGVEGEGEQKEPGEDLTGISVVHGLSEVVDQVLRSREVGRSELPSVGLNHRHDFNR